MIAIKGHFDGRVIVPDEPVDLPRNQPLIVRVEPADTAAPDVPTSTPPGVPGAALLPFAGTLSADEARAMLEAIEEGCERIDHDGW